MELLGAENLKELRKNLSGALARKITSRNSVWLHPKQKKVFIGLYLNENKGILKDRTFELVTVLKNGKPKAISFQSHESAKKAGWVKA